MIGIKVCETVNDFAEATRLMAELAAWDSSETEKLGHSAQSVIDFYYAAGSELPGVFTPKSGPILLGYAGVDVGGCIAYREVEPAVCELKRLYVRPSFRRTGLGRALVSALVARAHAAGYASMRLETVSFMTAAVGMYEAMGFVRRTPYYDIPNAFVPITIFMEKSLAARETDKNR
jgi:ribosomal protein S18 acetylase RimI-like enzyme